MTTKWSDYRKTLQVLIAGVYLHVGDPMQERYAPELVAEKINDAVLDFNLKTEIIRDEVNIQIKAGVTAYDVKGACDLARKKAPAFFLRVGYNGYDSAGLLPATAQDLDYRGLNASNNIYVGSWFIDLVSPGYLMLSGTPLEDGELPPSTGHNIQVYYAAYPEYMDTELATPDADIPPMYATAFVLRAAADILYGSNDVEDIKQAVIFDGLYDDLISQANNDAANASSSYSGAYPL